MHALLIILFMVIIGAIIGGVTNIIAVRMLFHPFKTYYIFNKRVPFTPGLIPKRRGEIATKIGQVIEEHLLTESLIKAKLNTATSQQAIHDMITEQIGKLKHDNATIHQFAQKFDIEIATLVEDKTDHFISDKLQAYYDNHYTDSIESIVPTEMTTLVNAKVENLHEMLFDRANAYLRSAKGTHDIASMLDTFFAEKGKIIGLLQMFMSKESIADRIQSELIRMTSHPKAKSIAQEIIKDEYSNLKQKPLHEVVNEEQFVTLKGAFKDLVIGYMQIDKNVNKPFNQLMPNFITYLESTFTTKLTHIIIDNVSQKLSPIMKKINLRGLVEEQVNSFELDYIEKLIIDIANKELKLIMSLGFLLGGIIGALQGVIAIFV